MAKGSKNRPADQEFVRVVQVSSALGFGLLAAVLFSVKEVVPHFRIVLSAGSGVAFALAALFSWVFWRSVFRSARQAFGPTRWLGFTALSVVLVLALIVNFAQPLKGLASEERRAMIEGAALAAAVLAVLGAVLRRLIVFFNKDGAAQEQAGPTSKTR